MLTIGPSTACGPISITVSTPSRSNVATPSANATGRRACKHVFIYPDALADSSTSPVTLVMKSTSGA
ncbi:MAG: hypothetical protein OXH97_10635, partial [Chloroflexota bacterium]|nr:hypothetical protein [Chloroflexota bacterium]